MKCLKLFFCKEKKNFTTTYRKQQNKKNSVYPISIMAKRDFLLKAINNNATNKNNSEHFSRKSPQQEIPTKVKHEIK